MGLIYILSYRELSELVDYYCTKLLCQLAFLDWIASTSHLVLYIDFFFPSTVFPLIDGGECSLSKNMVYGIILIFLKCNSDTEYLCGQSLC